VELKKRRASPEFDPPVPRHSHPTTRGLGASMNKPTDSPTDTIKGNSDSLPLAGVATGKGPEPERRATAIGHGRSCRVDRRRSREAAWLMGAWLLLAPAPSLLASGDAFIDPVKTNTAKWIAADAVAWIEVPHPELLIDRLTDPRVENYLKVLPQYQKFIKGKDFRELRTTIDSIAAQLGTTWEQGLRDLTRGGVLAGLEVDPASPPRPRVYLVVTPASVGLLDRLSQVVLKLARQDAQNKGKPDPVKTARYRGITVHTGGGENDPAFAIVSGRLAVSSSVKDLERLIDRAVAPESLKSGPASATKASLSDRAEWKSQRDRQGPDTLVSGFADLDRLRQLDPKRFMPSDKPDTGAVFLFGSWLEAIKKAPSLAASIRWSTKELGATLELPVPKGGRPATLKGFLPGPGTGTAPLIQPPGTIASLSLWRDWATIWESRGDLFSPEVVQGFAQLDTVAGQFFGAQEFGPDVLGGFRPHWRLVVARQDDASLKLKPDVKLPAFAVIADLNEADGEFPQRLKTAYQTFVAITNIEAAQKKAQPLELGSEEVLGVTLATSRYIPPRGGMPASGTAADTRYNFSPATAQVGRFFILSSSVGLARDLIKQLKPAVDTPSAAIEGTDTLAIEADGVELARLLELNRSRLVTRNMLDKGETKESAERQVELLLATLHYLGHGRLTIHDEPAATRVEARFQLGQ
jgi:hypothetical protein